MPVNQPLSTEPESTPAAVANWVPTDQLLDALADLLIEAARNGGPATDDESKTVLRRS